MVLKSLKAKDKNYRFESFGNLESDSPAAIIFNRFPLPDELFYIAKMKSVIDSPLAKNLDKKGGKEKFVEHVIDVMVDNMAAGRVDLRRFFRECVSHIENLVYEGQELKSVNDFFNILPEEAAFVIAQECYFYSKESDVFEAESKKN